MVLCSCAPLSLSLSLSLSFSLSLNSWGTLDVHWNVIVASYSSSACLCGGKSSARPGTSGQSCQSGYSNLIGSSSCGYGELGAK